jgi:hypothetical protein
MNNPDPATSLENHRAFAVYFHGLTWELLEKPKRTREDEERMLNYAHASLAHWRFCGTALHIQRGEWLLGRVHAVLGNEELVLRHARACLELTENHRDEMQDSDIAFAYELMARAYAIAGMLPEAVAQRYLANQAAEAITDPQMRETFYNLLHGEPWYDVTP